MGAIPYGSGTAFRVWAPHASHVAVKGDFNGWSDFSHPLGQEGNGYWYGEVEGAHAGQEYKYRISNGDNHFDRVDPYARQVTNSVGNGVIYDHGAFDWQGDSFGCPAHNELIIYETHIGSFAPGEWGHSNLDTVAGKLGYLRDLGINAIELMPVMEFAGDTSWGYNPAHIFSVESSYGGPDALKNFVKRAHEHGIAVILDVVYNHFGPSDLDLWQFDGWSENGKGGIYFFQDWRSSTPWGDTRPDYGRPEVRDFIRDNAMMWLRDYHVDGLRMDMTPYMRSVDATGKDIPEGWGLMRWVADQVRDQFPGRILIAEDLHGDPSVTSGFDGGANFHAQWDTHFVHPMRAALITQDDSFRSMDAVAKAVTWDYGDSFSRVIYTESHDEVSNGKARVPSEVDPGNPTGWAAQKRATMGMALTLTSPGIPMLFQGQEFLEDEWFRDYVPVDWPRKDAFRDIVRMVADLISLRRNWFNHSKGLTGQHTRVLHANEETKMLAFERSTEEGDSVVVVANFANAERRDYRIGMPAEGHWCLRFNSDAATYSALFGDFDTHDIETSWDDCDGLPQSGLVNIGPYSVAIFSR
ncbi:MAG: alpha amylase C-terminal domain-containing protein [Micrococcales bacterium]|nr:alpha amylase C-terminal domain-containing protein [Micrococcales bacterium]